MTYIHDHEAIGSEEMMVVEVGADVELGPGGHRRRDHVRAGPAAHRHAGDAAGRGRTPEGLEVEFLLDQTYRIFSRNRLWEVAHGTQTDSGRLRIEDLDVLQPEPQSHLPAHPFDCLVRRSMKPVDQNPRPDGLHDGICNRIARMKLLDAPENQGMMRHDHVRARLLGLPDQFHGAVQTEHYPMHLGIGRANAQACVVPLLLSGERGEVLQDLHYLPGFHSDLRISTSCARIFFRLSTALAVFWTVSPSF